MALFGANRDILLIKSINHEFIADIVEQQIGYYKPKLDQIKVNLYGESLDKFWIGPVLLNCLIQRGDFEWKTGDEGPDTKRNFEFRFFKDDLIDANVIPEVGDAVLWNEDYYEINGVNENRLIVGKDNNYSYSSDTRNFGSSLSIILTAHYTRLEKLGIKQDRL